MAIRNYVGARYVPKFADPVEWQANTSYEAMVIVTYNNASYTSKVPVPPTVDNPAENSKYWALTGNYNAQVEEYRQETADIKTKVNTNISDISVLKTNLTSHINNKENPHGVTKAQVGLGNVDNVSKANILQSVYPVGSIYMSTASTSPAELFAGTWEQIKDRFLLAAGDNAAGSTGGEAQHFLSITELPEHRMKIYDQETIDSSADLCPDLSSIGVTEALLPLAPNGLPSRATPGKRYWYSSTMSIGENKGHNNMPPYLTVYAWKRIA